MAERGTFRNVEHGRQLGRFDGMRWGSITPTDCDYRIDFNGRLWVYAEAKYGTAPVPRGQERHLESQCDLMHRPPELFAVAFIVRHWVQRDDFLWKETLIDRYRWAGAWHKPKKEGQTLFEGINVFHRLIFGGQAANEPPAGHEGWLAAYERVEQQEWPR